MPAKNTVRSYTKGGYYHIYNRGVDKRAIFIDEQDCSVFLYYLKLYLSSPGYLLREQYITPQLMYKITKMNLSNEVLLLSFAIMPNHFHLQLKQHTKDGIEKLMRRVSTAYVQYFNRKHKRVGTLFESTYKAVSLETTEQYLYLSSYIHRNPMKLTNSTIDFTQFSSYPYYLGMKNASWVNIDEILAFFRSSRNITKNDILSYQNFVESFREKPEEVLGRLTLEEQENV